MDVSLLTLEQAAAVLRLTPDKLQDMVQRSPGEIPHRWVKGELKFPLEEFADYVERHRVASES